MLTKARIKYIQSLQQKKNRKLEQLFVVEGKKMVLELLQSTYEVEWIYATPEFANQHAQDIKNLKQLSIVSEQELEKISNLNQPQQVLAVAKIPNMITPNINAITDAVIMLDCIQDPGNLGTIIRVADWYGINHIYCSLDTAELYNPKTIQASMGSFLRVNLYYVDLNTTLSVCTKTVYAALLNGNNIYQTKFNPNSVILIGNEGKGINMQLLNHRHQAITIPKIGKAESLNAGIATALFCDALVRSKI